MSESADRSPEPQRPAEADLRASDADRERVVEVLRQAAGEGRLEVAELDERTTAAFATRTLAGLRELTADLVAEPAAASTETVQGGLTVRPGPGGTRTIVNVMSGHDHAGRWRLAARCLMLNFMGGAKLDLTDAELAAGEVEIRVLAIMGGYEILVPSGVDVQVSRFAFMGGHDVKLDSEPPADGAPVIRLRLFALMGGGEVRQGHRGSHRAMRKLMRGDDR